MKQQQLEDLQKFLEDCQGLATDKSEAGKGEDFLLTHEAAANQLAIQRGQATDPADIHPTHIGLDYVDDVKREGKTLTITYHNPRDPERKQVREFSVPTRKQKEQEPIPAPAPTSTADSQGTEKTGTRKAKPVKGNTRK